MPNHIGRQAGCPEGCIFVANRVCNAKVPYLEFILQPYLIEMSQIAYLMISFP
jgi:hypothetical protein